MKGSLLYFAVVCLALASGAPADESSQLRTKVFQFDEKKEEVISSRNPLLGGELLNVVCEGDGHIKSCKFYVESATQDEHAAPSCDLNLKYPGAAMLNVTLFNAGNSKAVLIVRETDSEIKLISVDLKDCHVNEAVLGAQTNSLLPLAIQVIITSRDNSYDVVHRNKSLCGDFLCIATFDYEGNVVKTATSFPIKDSNIYLNIQSLDGTYLVNKIISMQSSHVYVIREKENNLHSHTLYSGPHKGLVALSTDEKKLGYCLATNEKTVCEQYDDSGENKKLEVEISTGNGVLDDFTMLNLEKGLLTMSDRLYDDTDNHQILVQLIDEHGKEGKVVKIDANCDKHKAVISNLYKSSKEEYCFSFYCGGPANEKNTYFTLGGRCFTSNELF